MKNNELYHLPKAGIFKRFLWDSAGGDRFLLERATYSDQVKYMCLGGIVFATGLMASLAGGYAFYTIFSPKTADVIDKTKLATSDTTFISADFSTVIKSIIFGIVWGLIIFNIDRFIVASTGKGDGTEKITRQELTTAIPRILMGAIIAITISKPIEIRMFKSEIDTKLYEKQKVQQKDFEIKTRKNFEDRIKDVDSEFATFTSKIADYDTKINTKDELYNVEMTKGQGGRGTGEGPVALRLKAERDQLSTEKREFINFNQSKMDEIDSRKKAISGELEDELKNNKNIAAGLDGLLERIKLSHEVAGLTITTFITLLFLAIELTPVFFKLMLSKSPYDYLKDNLEEELRAQNGIEVKYDYYKDRDGLERHLVINHDAENLIYEKSQLSKIQQELTDYALEKYKEREKRNIDENLKDYVQKHT